MNMSGLHKFSSTSVIVSFKISLKKHILLFSNSKSAILRDHNEIAVSKDFILKKDFVTLVKRIVQVKKYDFNQPEQTVKKVTTLLILI